MLGYDHDSFWDQTPRTLSLTFEAHRIIKINAHNERAWQAFTTAAFSRVKKLDAGALRRVTMREKSPTDITMEQQIESLVQWVQATGGKVIYRNQKDDRNG